MHYQRGLAVFLPPFYLILLFVVLGLNSEPGQLSKSPAAGLLIPSGERWCGPYILTGDYVLSSGQSRESRGWWWGAVIYAYLCLYEQIYEVSVVLEFIGQKLGEKCLRKSLIWVIMEVEGLCREAHHPRPAARGCLFPRLRLPSH